MEHITTLHIPRCRLSASFGQAIRSDAFAIAEMQAMLDDAQRAASNRYTKPRIVLFVSCAACNALASVSVEYDAPHFNLDEQGPRIFAQFSYFWDIPS